MTKDLSSPSANPVAAAVRRESDRAATTAPRERPKNFGGPRLKLDVIGEIPGYHLYWENDENGQIEQLLHEGFELVTPAEVKMQSHIVADADLSDRVSRYVGQKADGSPLRAFLMKCHDDLWKERESYRYQDADAKDRQIREGTVQHGEGRYKPKGADIKLNNQFSE